MIKIHTQEFNKFIGVQTLYVRFNETRFTKLCVAFETGRPAWVYWFRGVFRTPFHIVEVINLPYRRFVRRK